MKSDSRAAARLHLDRRSAAFKPGARFMMPPKGWIRAVRDALGMSAVQLGRRMGVKPQTIADIERSETHGTIQLKTLRRVAEALDCTLVYALVPNRPLESMVEDRARAIARRDLDRIAHSMDLEAQGLSPKERDEQIERYVRDHVRERDLWDDP